LISLHRRGQSGHEVARRSEAQNRCDKDDMVEENAALVRKVLGG
jgi:hypothetical protein